MVRSQLHSILPQLQKTVVAGKDVVVQDDHVLRKHNKIEGRLAVGIHILIAVPVFSCALLVIWQSSF
jgi:hypothetical protein